MKIIFEILIYALFSYLLLFFSPVSARVTLTAEEFFLEEGHPKYPSIEKQNYYDITFPVNADVLTELNGYEASYYNRYFMSLFGPRFIPSNYFDFHQGSDISPDIKYQNVSYSSENPPNIVNMCDGVVHEINNDPSEQSGKWVRVKCNQEFSVANWGKIYISYRHLQTIDVLEGVHVYKDELIGLMGNTGQTQNVHLHLSVQRMTENGLINVHPMRLFGPTIIQHLSGRLKNPHIQLLKSSITSSWFRVFIPFNEINLRYLRVGANDDDWSRVYDFESISEFGLTQDIDQNNFIKDLELFTYPFNRGHHIFRRYVEQLEIYPSDYPASPNTAINSFFPIINSQIKSQVGYILDIKVKNLQPGYDPASVFIEVVDIWGNGYRAYSQNHQSKYEHLAFTLSSLDAEENINGEVELYNSTLNLQSLNNETSYIGLQFQLPYLYGNIEVTNAHIQFTSGQISNDFTSININLENTLTPKIFEEINNDITARNLLINDISWIIPEWVKIDLFGIDQQSPNLASQINQLIFNQENDNQIKLANFILSGQGERVAFSADNYYRHKSPYLFVEYLMDDLIFANGF